MLKGLEDAVSLTAVGSFMGDDGWTFYDEPGVVPDTDNGARYLREVYQRADPNYTGCVTTLVLWDKEKETIVNNESRNIIRMFDHDFDGVPGAKPEVNFCPEDLREEVDRALDELYEPVNNGVYKTGFVTTQNAYDETVTGLFDALDRREEVLFERRYLCGERITEADRAFFATLVRFDAIYYSHFKCNLRRIVDYPNLWGYLKDLYQQPGVAETVDIGHIRRHYYGSHESINPTGIVPKGTVLSFDEPHGRERLYG